MLDRFKDACGIVGILGSAEASNLAYLGLYALQHRGQESAGIVSSDGDVLHLEKAMGLVADVFSETRLKRLKGHLAIGHVRYSTTGSSQLKNAQPILATCRHGMVALAHNGNLVNAQVVRAELEGQGSIFSTNTEQHRTVEVDEKVRTVGTGLARRPDDAHRSQKAGEQVETATWWPRILCAHGVAKLVRLIIPPSGRDRWSRARGIQPPQPISVDHQPLKPLASSGLFAFLARFVNPRRFWAHCGSLWRAVVHCQIFTKYFGSRKEPELVEGRRFLKGKSLKLE